MNIYRYARNNPLINLDPTGLVTAAEYATLTKKLNEIKTYCEFSKCVAKIWTAMSVSVTTLTPAEPPEDKCGLILMGYPQPNPQAILKKKVYGFAAQALAGTPPGLAIAYYQAAKTCGEYVNALPGGKHP